MSDWIYCKIHDIRFDENEGCEYCYREYKLISEFVNDLYNNDLTIKDMQKKWEEKLK